jgi:hypothetical protein
MKIKKIVPAYIVLALTVGMNAFGQTAKPATAKKGFAVLELFTSEGCSSCPPADDLMGKIQQEYKNEDVYVLAYHVDYWDRLGWKDIFSNADYTKRQYEYSKLLGTGQVYTPQVIVNGKTEHIGSQSSIVKSAIKKALSTPAAISVTLKSEQVKNSLTVSYTTNATAKNNRLLVAIVQKYAKSSVKRGENEGRVLSHYQIVRHLHTATIAAGGKGSIKLQLPGDFNAKDFEVVGFVQDITNSAILGVAKSGL